MKDESNLIYVGQRLGTILVTKIYLHTRTGPYQGYSELVDSAALSEIDGDEDRVSFGYKCDCRPKEQHVYLAGFLKCTKVYTYCPKCNSAIIWEDKYHARTQRQLKKNLELSLKPPKLPRINTLPPHVLAAHKIYHPGVEGCLRLLELFPTMPEGWAIRKLDRSLPADADNLFVENSNWINTKYKGCRMIEDNFKPSCKAEYLGRGEYLATCECGKTHKIPHSNLYNKHEDSDRHNTATTRRCTCIKKHKPKPEGKLTFEQRFAKNNLCHKFIDFVTGKGSRRDAKRMKIQHIACGAVYETSAKFSKRKDTCPCCAKYFTDFSRPMYLYYVRINTEPPIYKLGITQRNVRERFKKDPISLVTELKTWRFKVGMDAYNEEHRLLAKYKEFAYNGVKFLKSEGHTEMFTEDILGLDINEHCANM